MRNFGIIEDGLQVFLLYIIRSTKYGVLSVSYPFNFLAGPVTYRMYLVGAGVAVSGIKGFGIGGPRFERHLVSGMAVLDLKRTRQCFKMAKSHALIGLTW